MPEASREDPLANGLQTLPSPSGPKRQRSCSWIIPASRRGLRERQPSIFTIQPAADGAEEASQPERRSYADDKPAENGLAVLTEVPGETPETHLFYRGDIKQPRDVITPADLTIASPPGARFQIAGHDPALPTTGRRLAWARHLTDGKHPLVGRVLVNRIWLHHFGRPLVDTPGDFGMLGSRPQMPELLDLMALELVREGWSLKRMHKWIMTSTVYRQASAANPANEAIDPANSL